MVNALTDASRKVSDQTSGWQNRKERREKNGNRETQKCFSKLPQKCQKIIIIKIKVFCLCKNNSILVRVFVTKLMPFFQIYIHKKKKEKKKIKLLFFLLYSFVFLSFIHSFIFPRFHSLKLTCKLMLNYKSNK